MYIQLREVIRDRCETGEYAPGTTIPSENALAQTFGINRMTVRRSIDTLVSEGLLKRVQGKGVFVLGAKVERDLDYLSGFTQTMLEKGGRPSSRVLLKNTRRAGDKYGTLFNIDLSAKLFHIKRLRLSDDEPFALEEVWIPKYLIPKIDGIDLSIFSLYEVYGFYHIHLTRADQSIELATIRRSDAQTLGVPEGRSVLMFESTSYDDTDHAVEFARTYAKVDKCNFRVKFHR